MQLPNRYELVRPLGLGATSEVFETVIPDTQERVALKVFSPVILSDPESVQRLEAEVAALEQLRHPNIVSLLGTYSLPNFFALELELVSGTELRTWAKSFDLALLEPKLWLLVQVARGLGAAHEIGVLHRDLKPENILVSDDGDVKITDFGLSRSISRLTLTRIGLLVGSLGYMSPECVNGLRADIRSDVFSFGVIAYELLAGRPPFEGDTPQALIKQITEGRFVPLRQVNPSVPVEVAEILERCLSRSADDRPESIWSVEAALMNSLHPTRLANHCRSLVSVRMRAIALPKALESKHLSLREKIERLSAETMKSHADPTARTRLLAALQELKSLFPEDPLLAKSLSLLASRSEGKRHSYWPLVAVGVALLVSTFAWMKVRSARSEDTKLPPPALATAPVTQQTQARTSEPKPSRSSLPAPTPAIVRVSKPNSRAAEVMKSTKAATNRRGEFGKIVFELDSDVSAFVDDELVEPGQWASGYETSPGLKKIRLVKVGFDPIENTVDVKPGKTALIRAKR